MQRHAHSDLEGGAQAAHLGCAPGPVAAGAEGSGQQADAEAPAVSVSVHLGWPYLNPQCVLQAPRSVFLFVCWLVVAVYYQFGLRIVHICPRTYIV